MQIQINYAQWPAPKHIIAGYTTRCGGVSQAPFDTLNVALHVQDNPTDVLQNRHLLDNALPAKKQWQWLDQVHGTDVVNATATQVLRADACYSRESRKVCVVMTADCLPILVTDKQGREVAAIHAGWRSLCYGVIENTIKQFQAAPSTLLVYLAPAISVNAFEVGEDVRQAFATQQCGEQSLRAFSAISAQKYKADLYQLARIRLQQLGITQIFGGERCTYSEKQHFFSYRRDGKTGRMANFIYSNL